MSEATPLYKFQSALLFATTEHSDQYDKAGFPYILHPIRVAACMDTEEEKVVAVLHDVVEDNEHITIQDIENQFGPDTARSVDAITRRDNEELKDYLDRVLTDEIATRVKIKDMEDNLHISRLSHLPISQQLYLGHKYLVGRHYLTTGEWTG